MISWLKPTLIHSVLSINPQEPQNPLSFQVSFDPFCKVGCVAGNDEFNDLERIYHDMASLTNQVDPRE